MTLAAHPHFQRWMIVAGLVSDGFAFARRAAHGRRHSDRSAAKQTRPRPGTQRLVEAHDGQPQRKQDKRVKEAKRKGMAQKGQRAAAKASAQSESPTKAVEATDAQQVMGTTAGGGGRWVHVT